MTESGEGAKSVWRNAVRFVLGPWPFFPVVVATITFCFLLLQNLQVSIMGRYDSCRYVCIELPERFTPAISAQFGEEGLDPFDPILVFGNALITSVVIGLTLWLFSRVLRSDADGSPSRGPYLLAIVTASVVGGVCRILVLSPVLESTPSLVISGLMPNTLRTFLSITIVQSISGLLTARYVRQAAVATTALETVVQQQQLVVGADERARRNVAEFLHDRVQADLLVVAMQLRAAATDADPVTSERLEHAIAELERIRSNEVRSASRRLSPAFGSVGLDTALEELAESWDSVMRVSVSFDARARALLLGASAPRDLRTAVYRVTEQALLNCASHGQAGRVEAAITMPSSKALMIRVSDNGRGLPQSLERGSGSAIMDAWCAVVDGRWQWLDSGHGVVVEAVFPVAAETTV